VPTPIEFLAAGEVFTSKVVSRGLLLWERWFSRGSASPRRFSQLVELMHSRARRRFSRGLKRKPMALIKKLRKAKKEAPPNEKPEIVKTHLRNMIIVPEMTGSIIGVYNGKDFGQVRAARIHIPDLLCCVSQQRCFPRYYYFVLFCCSGSEHANKPLG